MVRDLSDSWAPLRKLQSRQRRAHSATPLRNATVSGGQTEFIGEESLKVTGSQQVTGELGLDGIQRVNGQIIVEDGEIIVPGVNPVRILQTPLGPTIQFGSATITSDGSELIIAGVSGSGTYIILDAAGVMIQGVDGTTTDPPNLHIDGVGRLRRSI